jgi:hypothetical protein
MMRFTFSSTLIVTALFAASCSDASSPLQPGEALFGKPAGGESNNLSATFHLQNAGSSVLGDGKAADGITTADPSIYKDGRCGVTATIFGGTGATGDAHLQTNKPNAKDRTCGARLLKAIYQGGTDYGQGIINVRGALWVPEGETKEGRMGVRIENSACYRLQYPTFVTRSLDGKTWTVVNRGNTALCETTNTDVVVENFSLTITTP